MVGAVCTSAARVDVLPIGAALVSGYAAAGLLGEVQGQSDLAICRALTRKLLASMRRDGKQPSSTTGDDSASAGAVALARWRQINERWPARRVRGSVVSVAWRAIVRESSRDLLGDAVPLGDGWQADDIFGSAVPLPAFAGDASREDKAARLAFERARAARPGQLAARLDTIAAAGGRGRRAESVAKVGHACALLLGGMSIDAAAVAAGFKARGSGRSATRAGDALGQAVRRLGFGFQFNLRAGAGSLVGVRSLVQVVSPRGFRVWQEVEPLPVSSVGAMVRGWAFRPSASLPVHRGGMSAREVKRQARLASAKARATQRGAVAGRWSAAREVRAAADRRAARLAARSAKVRGQLLGVFLPEVERGAAIRQARLESHYAAWTAKGLAFARGQ